MNLLDYTHVCLADVDTPEEQVYARGTQRGCDQWTQILRNRGTGAVTLTVEEWLDRKEPSCR